MLCGEMLLQVWRQAQRGMADMQDEREVGGFFPVPERGDVDGFEMFLLGCLTPWPCGTPVIDT